MRRYPSAYAAFRCGCHSSLMRSRGLSSTCVVKTRPGSRERRSSSTAATWPPRSGTRDEHSSGGSTMSLKLACADFAFPLLPHDNSLDLIAMLGFEGVDMGLFEGRSHLWPSRV